MSQTLQWSYDDLAKSWKLRVAISWGSLPGREVYRMSVNNRTRFRKCSFLCVRKLCCFWELEFALWTPLEPLSLVCANPEGKQQSLFPFGKILTSTIQFCGRPNSTKAGSANRASRDTAGGAWRKTPNMSKDPQGQVCGRRSLRKEEQGK